MLRWISRESIHEVAKELCSDDLIKADFGNRKSRIRYGYHITEKISLYQTMLGRSDEHYFIQHFILHLLHILRFTDHASIITRRSILAKYHVITCDGIQFLRKLLANKVSSWYRKRAIRYSIKFLVISTNSNELDMLESSSKIKNFYKCLYMMLI